MALERWRSLGLTREEWDECLEASRDLATLHPGEKVPSANEIAAQLAVAKAAELEWQPDADVSIPRRLIPEAGPRSRDGGLLR